MSMKNISDVLGDENEGVVVPHMPNAEVEI